MEAIEGQPGRASLVNPRRIVLTLLLVVAAGGFWLSGAQTQTEVPPTFTDSAVEAVFPGPDELDVRQSQVGIDLIAGYTAVLLIDGVEIPEDQLERIEPLGQVFYTPAVGKETGALEPGRHCAAAILWHPAEGTRESGRTYTWCFTVH